MNLTDKNFDLFKKKNPVFILGLSAKDCTQCCQTEDILNQFSQESKDGNYQYKVRKKEVKMKYRKIQSR